MKGTWSFVGLMCILLLALAPLLAACGDDDNGAKGSNDDQTNTTLSGTIDVAGSTSVQPLAEMMAVAFMDRHQSVRVNISGGGSSAGVRACAQGAVDLGAASRDIKITEQDLIPIAIARDAVAIAVHSSNPVSDLSLDQVKKIYEGKITNWKEVGGDDKSIVVISREEGSGTRDCFESRVTKEIKNDSLFFDSNGAIRSKVAAQSDAIGFLSLGYVEGLKALSLNGLEPTLETCMSGEYPVLRRLNLLSREIPGGVEKAFVDFCRSDEGQQIAEKEGYIPLMK
ncbi:MAG: phosphate ABC transporter substrate-binding protein [Dehalococcoidia bacterium]